MNITVCIGSSCHIRGSRQVVEALQSLIAKHNLGDKIELDGCLCTGNCQKGICVTVEGSIHSVTPDSVDEFFENVILKKV